MSARPFDYIELFREFRISFGSWGIPTATEFILRRFTSLASENQL
jgi:hypothetical protein